MGRGCSKVNGGFPSGKIMMILIAKIYYVLTKQLKCSILLILIVTLGSRYDYYYHVADEKLRHGTPVGSRVEI